MSQTMYGFEEYAVLLHKEKFPKIFEEKGFTYYYKLEKKWPAIYGESEPYALRQWLSKALESHVLNSMLYSLYANSSSLEMSLRNELISKLEVLYNKTKLFANVDDLERSFAIISKHVNTDSQHIAEYKYIEVFYDMLLNNETFNTFNAVDRLNIIISEAF
jgi:hypothetical protein